MKIRRSKHLRSGTTLAELLVIISAASVVLSTSAVLMHQIMRIHKKSQAFFDVERSAVRLSEQFRRDVHQANDASINAEAVGEIPFLKLHLASGREVAYSYLEGDVQRKMSHNGAVVSRDEFAFHDNADLTIHETEVPRQLVLTLATANRLPPGDGTHSPVPHTVPVYLQVEALLNRGPQLASEEPPQ